MAEQILRTGVVGVGHIGKNHARVYSELGESKLAAIYDTDPGAAKEAAGALDAEAVESLEAFADRIDAATVATPTVFHHEIATFLLRRGKHLLVEKPITETTAQAEELVRLAEENQCILQVGHIERFNPAMGALEERLTHPRFIEAHRLSSYPHRSTDISVVLDLMIHDLEIILHLVRSPVQHLDAVGVPVLSATEDIANVRLRFESGCVANVTASRISPEKMRKVRVFQEDAYLSLDYGEPSGRIYRRNGISIDCEEVALESEEPLKVQLRSFIECARQGKRPVVSGQEAMAALQVATDITRSIQSGHGASLPDRG